MRSPRAILSLLACVACQDAPAIVEEQPDVRRGPRIESLRATPGAFSQGDVIDLAWSAAEAASCSLTSVPSLDGFPITDAPPEGVLTVAPTASTSVTLVCRGPRGVDAREVRLEERPQVSAFRATPPAVRRGASTRLTWTVSPNDASCELVVGTQAFANVESGVTVMPEATTPAVLRCGRGEGRVEHTLDAIDVLAIESFSASPSPVDARSTVELSWTVAPAAALCSLEVHTSGGSAPDVSAAQPLVGTMLVDAGVETVGARLVCHATAQEGVVVEAELDVPVRPIIEGLGLVSSAEGIEATVHAAAAVSCQLSSVALEDAVVLPAPPFAAAAAFRAEGRADVEVTCTSDGNVATSRTFTVWAGPFNQLEPSLLDGVSIVSGNVSIAHVQGALALQDLERVGGAFSMSNNSQVTRLSAPRLEEVGGDMRINNNAVLTGLDLPALRRIGGRLEVLRNFSLPCGDAHALVCGLETPVSSVTSSNQGLCSLPECGDAP